MKRKVSVLLIAMLICACILAGCVDTEKTASEAESPTVSAVSEGETSDESTDVSESTEEESADESSTETEEAAADAEDVVGMVTALDETTIKLEVYVTEDGEAIPDYTRVDLDTLSADGTASTVEITDETLIYTTEVSTYLPAEPEDITVGDMLAVTTGADGEPWIIILTDMAEEEASESQSDEYLEAAGETEEASGETEEETDTEA